MDFDKAILQTLCYSDIFDYPLTRDEIFKYFITNFKSQSAGWRTNHKNNRHPERSEGSKKDSSLSVQNDEIKLISVAKRVSSFQDGYFCLKGREEIIKKRIEKKKDNEQKIQIAKMVAVQLAKIPSVKFVGISGAVAMKNAEKNDDIDLFIITKTGSLWFTRLFTTIVLDMQNLRRKRGQKNVANKICLNLFVDESSLKFRNKNLYTAHEIVQVVPLINKNQTYEKFISANKWVLDFMPNVFKESGIKNYESRKNMNRHPERSEGSSEAIFDLDSSPKAQNDVLSKVLIPLEFLAKKVQLLIMQKPTLETISDNMLAFHPVDFEGKILREYKRKLRRSL